MTRSAAPPPSAAEPWQLRMFDKTLKKRQKVAMLLRLLGPLEGRRCLLVTGGDNNGAMNHRLREAGGSWTWGEVEAHTIPTIEALLGEPVRRVDPARLPWEDGAFDVVVVIDVHEHLDDPGPLNREAARVLAPGGRAVVTVPNGNPWLPVAVLKRLVGMGPEQYGHRVQGFRERELEEMLAAAGLRPQARDAYARFFTELAELAINFGYVKVLSRKKAGPRVPKGTIAPTSEDQLRAVERTYRIYSRVYPFIRSFAALDGLVPGRGGYAVAVSAVKGA